MADFKLKQETPPEGIESPIISDHREYTIKIDEQTKYTLRLELKDKKIYLIVSLDDKIEYNYRTFMDLSTIVNKLELNSIKYNKLELILKIFDQLYENNKISIKINNDEYCSLIIKFIQITKEETYEIKIYKHYMNPDDKFRIMYNIIKSLKNDNNEMNEKINILNEKVENKEKIIDEMNIKLINQENKIKELNEKIVTLSNNYNNSKEEIKELDNLLVNQNNFINDNKIYLENKIDNEREEFHKEIDIMKELINQKNPKNLRFKCNITTTNTSAGWNDMFEIFKSPNENKEYLISPNSNNYNLDIFDLLDNKLVHSFPGHKNRIRTVRYNNNYLISADDDKIVIIWDINNNYKIKHKIKTNYGDNIYSCLLLFNVKIGINNYNDYIITSTYNDSGNDEDSATKVYSFKDGKFIKNINKTNNIAIYYLLSWINNNNYYIIQFAYKKILINNLITDEIYAKLINVPESSHYSGFITYGTYPGSNINGDFLFSSSENGYINIWNLNEKKIFKIINTNGCILAHIILWNNQYLIAADYNNKSFKIIDTCNDSIYDMKTEHKKDMVCIKKVNHPIYGESLLTTSEDNTIKLWI